MQLKITILYLKTVIKALCVYAKRSRMAIILDLFLALLS